MKRNLDEINGDIIKKIDSLDVNDDLKNFLKEALYIEYTHREDNFTLSDKRRANYEPLINRYYGGE